LTPSRARSPSTDRTSLSSRYEAHARGPSCWRNTHHNAWLTNSTRTAKSFQYFGLVALKAREYCEKTMKSNDFGSHGNAVGCLSIEYIRAGRHDDSACRGYGWVLPRYPRCPCRGRDSNRRIVQPVPRGGEPAHDWDDRQLQLCGDCPG
jgi:hypothetical protein